MNTVQRIGIATAMAIGIAAPAEGIRQVAYHDPGGVLTVCAGTTRDIVTGKTYSLEECLSLLTGDMLDAVRTVERCVPGLPAHMLAAWGDAVYNLGPKIVCDKANSTAARLLAAGRLTEACHQLPRWNKARVAGVMVSLPGLTKRRELEQQVCLGGVLA